MTYKHTKFEDSATMRSLEKLAREKGWVKTEPITKQASSELDLTPSLNLTENIIKLCTGLKKAGFDKYALELENKLIAYKQAASLYETSDEKGDDLIDFAHPKGSHKLEGVEGDEATVETILDQHLKLIEVINKKPHGKLASSKDILKAVKIALATPEGISEQEFQPRRNLQAYEQLKRIPSFLDAAKFIIDHHMDTTTLSKTFNSNYSDIIDKIKSLSITAAAMTVNDVDDIIGDLEDMENSINFFNWKDFFMMSPLAVGVGLRHIGDIADIAQGNWDSANRDEIIKSVNKAKVIANVARDYVRGDNDAGVLGAEVAQSKSKNLATSKNQEDTINKQNFQTRAKSVLEDLSTSKLSFNDKNKFTDAERAKFFPKIDAYVKQVQNLLAIINKYSYSSELLNQLITIEDWSAKLNKWMNS